MASTPISAIGNRRFAADAGVSLVEAMVALLVIGLIVGVVVLAAPGAGRRTQTEAERLAARISFAAEESVVVNRTHALVITDEGYGFERLEDNGWAPADQSSPLGFRAWPSEIEARVQRIDGGDEARVARFDAIGGVTPVAVILSGSGARWGVTVDARGGVDVARAE